MGCPKGLQSIGSNYNCFRAWITCQTFDQGWEQGWGRGERILGCSWSMTKSMTKSMIKQSLWTFFRQILSSFKHKYNQCTFFTQANPLVTPNMVHFVPKWNARYTSGFPFPTLLSFSTPTLRVWMCKWIGVRLIVTDIITKFSQNYTTFERPSVLGRKQILKQFVVWELKNNAVCGMVDPL